VHRHLEGVRGRRRRALAPERVDQPLTRDDLVRVQQQQREHGPLPRTAERERSFFAHDLERSQQPEVQPPFTGAHVHNRPVSES
jgi:hypothetical protein